MQGWPGLDGVVIETPGYFHILRSWEGWPVAVKDGCGSERDCDHAAKVDSLRWCGPGPGPGTAAAGGADGRHRGLIVSGNRPAVHRPN